jgi:hypothetical protein
MSITIHKTLKKWAVKTDPCSYTFYHRSVDGKLCSLIRYNFYEDVWEAILIPAMFKDKIKEFHSPLEAAIHCDLKLIDMGFKLESPLLFTY